MAGSAKTGCVLQTTQPNISVGCLRCYAPFSQLSEQEIATFNAAAQPRVYEKGTILYLQDDPAEFFYVICSGWVKVFHTLEEGDQIVVDMLTSGHLLGESAVFENNCHTSSTEIIEEAHLLSIPCKMLREQIKNNSNLAFVMLSAMFRHHRRHYNAIALNATQTAPQRVGCFLLRLCPYGKKTGIIFNLPYDKTLIAHILGMEIATFSRALNILRHKTSLRVHGNQIQIDNMNKLTKFVYGTLTEEYE